jgi:hypothetical protein
MRWCIDCNELPRGKGALADPPDSVHDEDLESQIAASVIEYVTRNPHAMDTVKGIAAWWIGAASSPVELTTVRRVVDRLVDRGVLERVGSGDNPHYRLRAQPEQR